LEERVFYIINDDSDFQAKVCQAEGGPLFLASATLDKTEVIADLLQQADPGASMLIMNRQRREDPEVVAAMNDPNGEWPKYKYVLISPSVTVGIDFTVRHFQRIAVYGCQHTVVPRVLLQMHGRIRYPLTKEVVMYLPKARNGLPTNRDELVAASIRRLIETTEDHESIHIDPVYNGLYVRNLQECNEAKNNYRRRMIQLLEDRGAAVVEDQPAPPSKLPPSEYKRRRAEAFAAAEPNVSGNKMEHEKYWLERRKFATLEELNNPDFVLERVKHLVEQVELAEVFLGDPDHLRRQDRTYIQDSKEPQHCPFSWKHQKVLRAVFAGFDFRDGNPLLHSDHVVTKALALEGGKVVWGLSRDLQSLPGLELSFPLNPKNLAESPRACWDVLRAYLKKLGLTLTKHHSVDAEDMRHRLIRRGKVLEVPPTPEYPTELAVNQDTAIRILQNEGRVEGIAVTSKPTTIEPRSGVSTAQLMKLRATTKATWVAVDSNNRVMTGSRGWGVCDGKYAPGPVLLDPEATWTLLQSRRSTKRASDDAEQPPAKRSRH
jgi:hypothetical protein